MENTVSINHTKKNVLEFDITVEGADSKSVEVRFCVKAKGMELTFPAKQIKGEKWEVRLPELSMLDKTAYKCYIAAIVDGYYFEPMNGTLNVVGTAQIYTSGPKNKTLEPEVEKKEEAKPVAKEEKKPVKKVAAKKDTKKVTETNKAWKGSIEQTANKLMENKKVTKKTTKATAKTSVEKLAEELMEGKTFDPKKKEDVTPVNEKNDKVMAILEECGISPKKKKKSRLSIFS